MSRLDLSKTTFLLGSGISIPSGLPSTEAITESLLQKDWLFDSEQRQVGIPLTSPFAGTGYFIRSELTSGFIRILSSILEQYAAMHRQPRPNYEDMYYLAKQVGDSLLGEYENPALLPLISDLRSKVSLMMENINVSYGRDGVFFSKEGLSLEQLVERSLEFIEECVAQKLCFDGPTNGLRLLDQMLKLEESSLLHLVSLNHDLLLEKFLAAYGVSDGFVPFSPDLKRFDSGSFEANSGNERVQLLKPHGSIDWYVYKHAGEEVYAKLIGGDVDHPKAPGGDALMPPVRRLMLAGNANKELSYGEGVFLELLFRFHQRLQATETLIVSGYGFRDKGINNRIWHWLDQRPANQLIILHADKENLLRSARPSLNLNVKRLEKAKKIKITGSWLCDTSLKDLEKMLAEPLAPETKGGA